MNQATVHGITYTLSLVLNQYGIGHGHIHDLSVPGCRLRPRPLFV